MQSRIVVGLLFVATWAVLDVAAEDAGEKELGWSNSTEVSMVVTDGNSKSDTLGLKNTLLRRWERSQIKIKLDVVRAETADDRFVVVGPGLTWLPGADPPAADMFTTVAPGLEPDAERFFAEGQRDKNITDHLLWHSGLSWEKNEDAGILNRLIAFGGLGNNWKQKKDLEFTTSYGLSYTYREEDEPDPLKDETFAGLRFSSSYMNKFGKATTYRNELTANLSLEDTADYHFDMTNSLSVKMTHRLAIKISMQHLYSSEPALEEVDVFAFVELFDPDMTPGSGDEFFMTTDTGNKIELGKTDIRKDELDTIFRTAIVIDF